MPVSPDPSQTVSFTFETIDGRRLPFVTRFLTRRQRMAYQRAVEKIDTQPVGSPELEALLDEALAVGTDYTVESLSDDLTDRDIIEFALRYPAAAAIGEDALGESKSRRILLAATSAVDAARADASMPPPKSDG